MADRLGMDPARIERLRSAERLAYFDPDRIWDTVDPDPRSTLVDIDLPDRCADLIVMAQLHHELDAPQLLLSECRRLLAVGGTVAIIDWKDVDNDKGPPADQSVPAATIRAQLQTAGFSDIRTHDVFRYHTFLTAGV